MPFCPSALVAQLVHRDDVHPSVGSIHLAHLPPLPQRPRECFLGRVAGRVTVGPREHEGAGDAIEEGCVELVERQLAHRAGNATAAGKV